TREESGVEGVGPPIAVVRRGRHLGGVGCRGRGGNDTATILTTTHGGTTSVCRGPGPSSRSSPGRFRVVPAGTPRSGSAGRGLPLSRNSSVLRLTATDVGSLAEWRRGCKGFLQFLRGTSC